MLELFDRRGFHLVIQTVRFSIVAVLWALTLLFGSWGLARFTRVFTGDESFGALDGFQFVEAMYGAAWRILVATITCWSVWRILRWDPGGRRASAAAARDRRLLDIASTGIDPNEERVCPLLELRGISAPGDLRRCPLIEAHRRVRRRERSLRRLRTASKPSLATSSPMTLSSYAPVSGSMEPVAA